MMNFKIIIKFINFEIDFKILILKLIIHYFYILIIDYLFYL